MSMHSQRDVHFKSWIVNMTNCPFDKYDDATGRVKTFFPSLLRSSTVIEGLPRSACYVFAREMEDKIRRFRDCGYDVAVIEGYSTGRHGSNIATLMSLDDDKVVVFRNACCF